MAGQLDNLSYKFKALNALEKIIAIDVLLFVVAFLLDKLFRIHKALFWLELPSQLSSFIVKPWSILTYGFVHYDIFHLLFNMLFLYYLSRMLLNLFSTKLVLNIYFLGILFGGLCFMAAYNILPQSMVGIGAHLVGASAGVRALLLFLCAYMPNNEVRVIKFNVKLKWVGIFIVVIDVLGLFGGNMGGHVAHLGGGLLGYLYATQLLKGNDIGKGFERFMDSVMSLFQKKSNLKTVHKRKKKDFAGHTKEDFSEFNKQKKIDLILDKISKSGYESLTKDEKAYLFKAGKE
ncbi:MAG: rhomboid family intramembrane serine protease [Bacteroidetes bacterium MedPE-SWsnd-G2]|nr:MAG: rhomboid family intramembrane serine protease [Bacteroidetes bacterium MedPE-SWsnd-G2]